MRNENKLTERVEIYSNEDVKVESAKLTSKGTSVQVAIKSSRRQTDERRTEVFRGRFINEIINYQLIKNRVKSVYSGKKVLPNILNCEISFAKIDGQNIV
jgi:hypothetical protein